jgi:septum formation protein
MASHSRSRQPKLVLASGSPRRRELLERVGLTFEIAHPTIDEAVGPGERPGRYVARLAREKAQAVAPRFPGALLIAADTSVVLGNRLLGKPENARECLQMMASLSGQPHTVLTGVHLLRSSDGASAAFVTRTRVDFDVIPPAWAKRYAATPEPYDKAGGYGLQGAAGGFIRSIRGSVTNVVGLPVVEVIAGLQRLGYRLPWVRR